MEVSALSFKPRLYSYSPTCFNLTTIHWLRQPVKCMMIWVKFQHSNGCDYSEDSYFLSSILVHHYLLWRFCFESTSLLFCCYSLACGLNMATTLPAFRAEYNFWRSNRLKLLEWLHGNPALYPYFYGRHHFSLYRMGVGWEWRWGNIMHACVCAVFVFVLSVVLLLLLLFSLF